MWCPHCNLRQTDRWMLVCEMADKTEDRRAFEATVLQQNENQNENKKEKKDIHGTV